MIDRIKFKNEILHTIRWAVIVTLFFAITGYAGENPNKGNERNIFVCVDKDAPQALQDAASEFVKNREKCLLFQALKLTGQSYGVQRENSQALLQNLNREENYNMLAFNYLVVIGLPDQDPLLKKCDDHTVKIDTDKKTLYSMGYGKHTGDIGWVEIDRNPFEYSQRIVDAKFTTLIVKITGTSEIGVLAALQKFSDGLLNGAVCATTDEAKSDKDFAGFLRRDLDVTPPPLMPQKLPDGYELAGWTQIAEDEYRAFLDYGAAKPQKIWRLKYLKPDSLAGVTLNYWNNTPHRKAFGNSINIAQFTTPQEALSAFEAFKKHNGGRNTPKTSVKRIEGKEALIVPVAKDMCAKNEPSAIIIVPEGNAHIFSTLPEISLKAFLDQYKHLSE